MTNHTVTVVDAGATAKQFVPESLDDDVGTNYVALVLDELDWGVVPVERWTKPRVLGDGQIRRGKVHGARDLHWRVAGMVQVGTVVAAGKSIENVRDDALEELLDFLNPLNGPFWLRQARQNQAGTAVSRQIKAELKEIPSWVWQPDDWDSGFVGPHGGPAFVVPLEWVADFPWFQDVTAGISSQNNTLDSTLRTSTLTNNGVTRCGVTLTIDVGTGTATTITVYNDTAGVPAFTKGGGFTISNVVAANGDVTIRWYDGDDPTTWSITQGGSATDIRAQLAVTKGLWFNRGSNDIKYQRTGGTGTWQLDIQANQLWGAP